MPLLKTHPYYDNIFVEVGTGATDDWNARCFRFNEAGHSEWTSYGTLSNVGPNYARWYGHSFTKDDFRFL